MSQEHAVEDAVGTVTHYSSHLDVAVVALYATLHEGDRIRIKGHTTDLVQAVGSMEVGHLQVEEAGRGDDVGIHVDDHVREHDRIYLE